MTEKKPNRESADHWCVHLRPKAARLDGHGREVLADARQAGLDHLDGVQSSRLYFFSGALPQGDIERLARDLLADPVAESFEIVPSFSHRYGDTPAVEIHTLPGVMNPVATSTEQAARRLLRRHGSPSARVDQVLTARRYSITGARSAEDLVRLASQVLANDCIECWYIDGFDRHDRIPDVIPEPPTKPFEVRHVPLRELTDEQLTQLSRTGHLFLSLDEMRAVRDHFVTRGREPIDLELETLAQTWSEHCVHKTLKSAFVYRGDDFGKSGRIEVRFENLLRDTIAHVTRSLDRDWCLSVFEDNAGVIAFDDDYGIAFKAETHNHPSAIEPYGGAATGIGGCIRDIMGCGLGAKPIASTDVFCVAPPDYDANRLPKDVLHPRRVLKGVVAGVRDYGNRMGIPTVNGAVYFDDRYMANPLVFCGCVGLIPRNRVAKAPQIGDRIVVAGGRTGRDGIHGATFSSAELTDTHADEFSHAVQIGNAIEEKKVLDALLLARDHADGCLYTAVTDCGAGGLSSAVGEMGATLGADVELSDVPLKYSGLRYDEIWISEAQERMVFSVPPQRLDAFLEIFAAEEVEATVIGTFTGDGMLRVRHQGSLVGEIEMDFLHNGLPQTTLTATWTAKQNGHQAATPSVDDDGGDANLQLVKHLGAWNTASKEWIIRQYDHEVQGRSVIKPLAGPAYGPSDAAVLRPLYGTDRGIVIACGLCPHRSDVDPYLMAIEAVDEAVRNAICTGADPDRIAILDNFCWPKVDNEHARGALVRACRGAADAAMTYRLPFVSGKDSLNNEFSMGEAEARRVGLPSRIAIPGTLLISAVSVVQDVNRCVTMDLKRAGSRLVLASAPLDERDLSISYAVHLRVAGLIASGRVLAAHDVSDGGLAVTVAEMCIASGLGAKLDIDESVYPHALFRATPTSYVLEMEEGEATSAGLPLIGHVTEDAVLRINHRGRKVVDQPIQELAQAWRTPLAQGGGR